MKEQDFLPSTGSVEEWNRAYYRLEDYLRANFVVDKLEQSQIILRLLERAAQKHALDPSQSPTTLALNEAFEEMEDWFQMILPDEPAQQISVTGRVRSFMIDAQEKWPDVFLSRQNLPPAFVKAMREMSLQPGPEWRVSRMAPRPLDSAPAPDSMVESWENNRGVAVAVLAMLVLGFVSTIALYVRP